MNDLKLQQLIRTAKGRDPDAFTELIRFYMKDLYRAAIAILRNDEDAADAIQETILTCWEKLQTLKNPNYFKTWLTRILIHHCYDIRRTAGRYVSLEQQEELAQEGVYETSVYDPPNREFKELLEVLGEKYRVILTLYYGLGYSAAEIGELLHLPAATVRTRLARGRKKLKEYYEKEQES